MKIRMGFAWVAVLAGLPQLTSACTCRDRGPACTHLDSDAIFVGRAASAELTGTGKFALQKLVHFEVEERFKGVADDVGEIAIRTDYATTCYEGFTLGKRYLIFARHIPSPLEAMGLERFLPKERYPPARLFYASLQCSGSRPVEGFPNIEGDLAMLRHYRASGASPRILGHVVVHPFRGWPVFGGPRMRGARVTITGGGKTIRTLTDAHGFFAVPAAEQGSYYVRAEISPYRDEHGMKVEVPPVGCGFADVQVSATGSIRGIVLDQRGRPVPDVHVGVRGKEKGFELDEGTDRDGKFEISRVPDGQFMLYAGSESPATESPYRRVFYPGTRSVDPGKILTLKPGEHLDRLVLWLDEPSTGSSVYVRVELADGRPASSASVRAFGKAGGIQEISNADANGQTALPCLVGFKYEANALKWPASKPVPGKLLESQDVAFVCGDPREPIRLVLR
jgi:hypothetical protein